MDYVNDVELFASEKFFTPEHGLHKVTLCMNESDAPVVRLYLGMGENPTRWKSVASLSGDELMSLFSKELLLRWEEKRDKAIREIPNE